MGDNARLPVPSKLLGLNSVALILRGVRGSMGCRYANVSNPDLSS
jgi:hypothetical protein